MARTIYSRPLSTLLPLPGFATMQIAMCAVIARGVNWALRLDPKSIQGREVGAYGWLRFLDVSIYGLQRSLSTFHILTSP